MFKPAPVSFFSITIYILEIIPKDPGHKEVLSHEE
jgi:hypothetical protein